MDPNWVAVIVGVVSSIISALFLSAIGYAALRAWMARREEREAAQGVAFSRLERVQDEHGRAISDYGGRIRVLENEIDLRPPPLDYPRRA